MSTVEQRRRPGQRRAILAGLLALLAVVGAAVRTADAGQQTVTKVTDLRDAMLRARPGDVITLAPGDYAIRGPLRTGHGGEPDRPITVRGERPGTVRLLSTAIQTFVVTEPDWRFENLVVRGVCPRHGNCEHAFHVIGDADRTVIRGSRLVDFNAHIKGNGRGRRAERSFPDDVVITDNQIYNTSVRDTERPVALIDVVGGQGWVVRDNYIGDFGKVRGNATAHGAFLKGNSSRGVFERNLVVCSWRTQGGSRVGLSLGGGGVRNPDFCEDFDCSRQHRGGILRNNVIANCSDVGIYLNRAEASQVLNNTVLATKGIDVRYPETSAEIHDNVLDGGAIREREGGRVSASGNAEGRAALAFDPGRGTFLPVPRATGQDGTGGGAARVASDFCGHPRRAGVGAGAIAPDGLGACNPSTRLPTGEP